MRDSPVFGKQLSHRITVNNIFLGEKNGSIKFKCLYSYLIYEIQLVFTQFLGQYLLRYSSWFVELSLLLLKISTTKY